LRADLPRSVITGSSLQLKRACKERAVGINSVKRQLDEQLQLAERLAAERMQATEAPGGSGGEASQLERDAAEAAGAAAVAMMGPEELCAVQHVNQLKAAYRDQYNELQMLKSEVAYTQQLVEQCSQQLLLEFEEW
jgi:kinesin family protein 6/9